MEMLLNIYGISASGFTQDIKRATKVQRNCKAGRVQINCRDPKLPFGGFKKSGLGRDLDKDVSLP